MRRNLWFWLSFVSAIILAIYFISRIIMVGLGHGDLARVHKISFTSDVENKDMTALMGAISVPKNTPIYSLDLDVMTANLLGVPGIKDAAVRRLPNSTLRVRVAYHHFVATWSDGMNYFPLSDDGTIVQNPSSERPESALLFRGPVPNDLNEITNAANDMVADIDYIEWIEDRRWNIHTTGGITIKLPEENFSHAIAELITLNKNQNILDRDIHVIDMRDSARILVK